MNTTLAIIVTAAVTTWLVGIVAQIVFYKVVLKFIVSVFRPFAEGFGEVEEYDKMVEESKKDMKLTPRFLFEMAIWPILLTVWLVKLVFGIKCDDDCDYGCLLGKGCSLHRKQKKQQEGK